jgi:hypothetical protein
MCAAATSASRLGPLQVMRFDVASTGAVNPPFDATKLNAALKADYKKTVTPYAAPAVTRQASEATQGLCIIQIACL